MILEKKSKNNLQKNFYFLTLAIQCEKGCLIGSIMNISRLIIFPYIWSQIRMLEEFIIHYLNAFNSIQGHKKLILVSTWEKDQSWQVCNVENVRGKKCLVCTQKKNKWCIKALDINGPIENNLVNSIKVLIKQIRQTLVLKMLLVLLRLLLS